MEDMRRFILVYIALLITTHVSGQCLAPQDLTAVREKSQTFTSPGFPNNYPDNINCVWRIKAEQEDDVVQIVTERSTIEKQFGVYGCTFDYSEAYDGDSTAYRRLGRWCGTSTPTYISSSRAITVTFHSDQSHSRSGFQISYKAGKAESLHASEKSVGGISMLAAVGYFVAALAVLSVLMIFIRIFLSRLRPCKCLEDSRQRFVRTDNGRRQQQMRGRATPSDVGLFVVPISPPSYDECLEQSAGAPPPYTEILVAPYQGSAQPSENINDNPMLDSCEQRVGGFLPPPYESITETRNDSCVSCEDLTSINTDSTNGDETYFNANDSFTNSVNGHNYYDSTPNENNQSNNSNT